MFTNFLLRNSFTTLPFNLMSPFLWARTFNNPPLSKYEEEGNWRRKSQPTPVLLPGESHGGRILVGYSPWGCKELDMTERLHDPSMKEK